MKVLITILDWGIGHATRMIPLIQLLEKNGMDITVAASGAALTLIEKELPQLDCIEMPASNMLYSSNKKVLRDIIKQLPSFTKLVQKEKIWLDKYIESHPVDLILSDNRYGCFHENIKSVIITHQLHLKGPKALVYFANKLISKWINRFDECWIPDGDPPGLTGKLTNQEKLTIPTRRIGILSRCYPKIATSEEYLYLGVVGGPENSRTHFEDQLLGLFSGFSQPSVIICGNPTEQFDKQLGNVRMIAYADAELVSELVSKSKHIIMRSGYSSIMDLIAMERSALLVPTPGQTEQEYLAEFMHECWGWPYIDQKDLNFDSIKQAHYPPFAIQMKKLGLEDLGLEIKTN